MIPKAWQSNATLLAICLAGALLQYWPTFWFGFVYDDYHFIRPYDAAEILRAFHGTWDPTGVEPHFYRPLTVLLYALRFDLFGLNETAYHAASILMFALAGALAAIFASRVTGRLTTGMAVALFWTVHPNAPLSLAAWITNQMHLAQTLVIVASLLWWWRIKSADWRSWLPLLVAGAMAFLIKEDGLLLLPVLVIAHELYRWLCDDRVPHVSAAFVVSALLMLVGLFLLRRDALGGLGGYGAALTRDSVLTNLLKGPAQTLFLQPVQSIGTMMQAWGMTLALLVGSALGLRRQPEDRRALFLIALGVLIVGLFDLPFALITKREQYYALTLGAVLVFGVCSDAITLAVRPRLRIVPVALFVIVIATMSTRAAAARDLLSPFSESTLATDRLVEGWAPVPFEMRDWLNRKLTTRQVTSLSRDVPYVVFGASDLEHDPRGLPFRWIGRHAWIFTRSGSRGLTFTLRAANGEQPARPFLVDVSGGTPTVSRLRIEPGQQQVLNLGLRRQLVRLDVDHTWTPGPHDPRQLGLILSAITIQR